MLKNEDIKALVCLGLSTLQARVYLALTNLGRANTKNLAKNSNVARQDIYRITTELQNIGIVEKIIAIPNEYRAIPIQDGIKILLERKQKENSEVQKKAVELLQRQKDEEKEHIQEGKSEFVLISKNQALLQRMAKAIETTQSSIDAMTSWVEFLEKINTLSEEVERALYRGITIRLVIKENNTDRWPKKALLLMKNPQFKVKVTKKLPTEILTIYDRKEALMTTSASGSTTISPALWSDNSCIVAIAQDAFEKMWHSSKVPKFVTEKGKPVKSIQ